MTVVPLRDQERFVTTGELAGFLGLSDRSVERLVARGLPVHRWGLRANRFLPSEALAWLAVQDKDAA